MLQGSIISLPVCFPLELWELLSSCTEQAGSANEATRQAQSTISVRRKLVCEKEGPASSVPRDFMLRLVYNTVSQVTGQYSMY